MSSDYNHNSLTEVALALSMAFFALMVLSIFALSQKEQEKASIKSLVISDNTQAKKENKINSKVIFYFENKFYNKNFKIWDLNTIKNSEEAYILAVPSKISVEQLFLIKTSLKNLNVKITQQSTEWENALNKYITRKDHEK
tara:strand:- start:316 stop:738 length:423 start_codon:yes stop_codon:yes gene_type:complete